MKFDFLKQLYLPLGGVDEFINVLSSNIPISQLTARAFPCYIEDSFLPKPENYNGGRTSFQKSSTSNMISVFTLKHFYSDRGVEKKVQGNFFLLKSEIYENIYLVVTIENSFLFNHVLLPFFDKAFPHICLTFISHRRLQNLLFEFKGRNQFENLQIVRASIKSRIGENLRPSITWPEFSLEDAFQWIHEQNGWFQSLSFKAQKHMSPKNKITISRQGIVKANNYFKLVYESLLLPISKSLYESVTFFGKRSRKENNKEIRPLCIDFGREQFRDKNENNRFINAIRHLRAASVSVFHSNPYIHLTIFDYFDGSAFDVWVLSPERVIIVPQMRGSMQATKRLVNNIFDFYAEGEIKDYEIPK